MRQSSYESLTVPLLFWIYFLFVFSRHEQLFSPCHFPVAGFSNAYVLWLPCFQLLLVAPYSKLSSFLGFIVWLEKSACIYFPPLKTVPDLKHSRSHSTCNRKRCFCAIVHSPRVFSYLVVPSIFEKRSPVDPWGHLSESHLEMAQDGSYNIDVNMRW